MPRYNYICEKCSQTFEAIHSISEKIDKCPLCDGEACVSKCLGQPFNRTLDLSHKDFKKAGSIVGQSIEDAKQELKEEKKNLRSRHD
jgi:putative FmdB family regulatory protein